MTVPRHLKFVFRGVFVGTPEEWSFGLHYNSDHEGGADASYDNVDSGTVDDAITAFMGSAIFPAWVQCSDWRLYDIGTNGKTQGNPFLRFFDPGSEPHGSGAPVYPPQVSVAVSKVAVNRGPAKRGRFYLPGVKFQIDADGRLSSGAADLILAAAETFVKGVSDAVDLPGTLGSSALNNISSSPALTGTRQNVDHLEVGRALDTIRSRRTKLDEDYHAGGTIDW